MNNDLQTIMAERCEITSRHKNEKKEWRIVRVNTESWRREHSCVLPRLTSMAEADSDKARVSRIVQLLENGGRADNRLRVGCGVEREVRARPRAHGTIWRSGCSAAPPPRRLTSSGFRAVMALCGLVVTLHRQTIGCRSRAAVGSTSSAAAGYWLL